MIFFPVLRTHRLTVQMRELSIGEGIELAAMPTHMTEANNSAFLSKVVQEVSGVGDLKAWTVQERALAICHYLASTSENGPDFSVGKGRYSDYLDGESGNKAGIPDIELGRFADDVWRLRHLTGYMVESIERMTGEIETAQGRFHWMLGAMACQLIREGEDCPDPADGEGVFDAFLVNRMRIFSAFPESEFAPLFLAYLSARKDLEHLFYTEFGEEGLLILPKGGDASGLPPARFPAHSCVSQLAKDLGGKPH